MIDFTAIEEEVISLIMAGLSFTSTCKGYIREVVPITAMPALDVDAHSHKSTEQAHARYTISVLCAIRSKGVDREENARKFKAFVRQICERLESGYLGTSFNVIRNIASEVGSGETGEGAMVRTAVIRFDCLV